MLCLIKFSVITMEILETLLSKIHCKPNALNRIVQTNLLNLIVERSVKCPTERSSITQHHQR